MTSNEPSSEEGWVPSNYVFTAVAHGSSTATEQKISGPVLEEYSFPS